MKAVDTFTAEAPVKTDSESLKKSKSWPQLSLRRTERRGFHCSLSWSCFCPQRRRGWTATSPQKPGRPPCRTTVTRWSTCRPTSPAAHTWPASSRSGQRTKTRLPPTRECWCSSLLLKGYEWGCMWAPAAGPGWRDGRRRGCERCKSRTGASCCINEINVIFCSDWKETRPLWCPGTRLEATCLVRVAVESAILLLHMWKIYSKDKCNFFVHFYWYKCSF